MVANCLFTNSCAIINKSFPRIIVKRKRAEEARARPLPARHLSTVVQGQNVDLRRKAKAEFLLAAPESYIGGAGNYHAAAS